MEEKKKEKIFTNRKRNIHKNIPYRGALLNSSCIIPKQGIKLYLRIV